MRVAYLGPPGTFSEEAALLCELTAPGALAPYPTIADAWEAALGGAADLALLPAENSLEGSVGATLDLLVHRGGLRIRREVALPVRHQLLAREGSALGAITRVVSHPQALAQCAGFLRARLPGAVVEAASSTAEAARVAAGRDGVAALASRAAAARYGLSVLAADVQDGDDNTTRFVVVGREEEPPTGRDRTSIAFTLDRDRPGGLHEVLGELAARAINLSKIESRPTRKALGHYVFFVDFEGHAADPGAAAALEGVRARAHALWQLGSYPRAT